VLYAVIAAAGGVYVFVALPETKGKSLLEVQQVLQNFRHSTGNQNAGGSARSNAGGRVGSKRFFGFSFNSTSGRFQELDDDTGCFGDGESDEDECKIAPVALDACESALDSPSSPGAPVTPSARE
jgi:hypothetical protein